MMEKEMAELVNRLKSRLNSCLYPAKQAKHQHDSLKIQDITDTAITSWCCCYCHFERYIISQPSSLVHASLQSKAFEGVARRRQH